MSIEDELPGILDTFSGVAAKIRRLFSGTSLLETPSENRLICMLFSSLFANFVACVSLLRARNFLSVSLVLRPVLEACADIQNLTNIPGYIERIHCSTDKHYRSYLKGLARLEKVPSYVGGDLPNCENRLAAFAQRGIKPLKINEKFFLAGMADEYVAVYSMMSGAIHNDYNLTLKKEANYYENFSELHEKQSRAYEMLLGYLLVLHHVISVSVEVVARRLSAQDVPLYDAIISELKAVNEKLHFLRLIDEATE